MGSPAPPLPGRGEQPPAPTELGACGLCGTNGEVVGWRHAVSDNFGDWDRLPHRSVGTGLCPPCAWAFKHRPLRTWPWIVQSDGPTFKALPSHLAAVLAKALPPTVAVSIPIGRQKHVMPFLRWGRVGVDNEQLVWRDEDAELLAVYADLRRAGFGEKLLAAAEPAWAVLKSQPDPGAVLVLWELMAPWRRQPGYLDVAARATRKDKEGGSGDG